MLYTRKPAEYHLNEVTTQLSHRCGRQLGKPDSLQEPLSSLDTTRLQMPTVVIDNISTWTPPSYKSSSSPPPAPRHGDSDFVNVRPCFVEIQAYQLQQWLITLTTKAPYHKSILTINHDLYQPICASESTNGFIR